MCAGAAYAVFTVRRLREWGHKRPRLLQRILQTASEYLYFLFFFSRNSSYSSPQVRTSTWPLTQSSLDLSQESCSRPCSLAWGFSHPGPCAGPRDLIVLKHSSYHLIFQCPLQFLVSDIHICCSTGGCSLCSSDQLGVSPVPRGKWTPLPPISLPSSAFFIVTL